MQRGAGGGEKFEVGPEAKKRQKLDAESNKAGDDNGERHDEPRKVNLSEEIGIAREGSGRGLEGGSEVIPPEQPAEIEKHGRHTIGRNLGHFSEDNSEHHRHKERLDDEPQRTQHRLLVFGDEVAMDEQPEQIAVTPDIGEVQLEPTLGRLDDNFVISRNVEHRL